MNESFHCAVCEQDKPVAPQGSMTTGYGVRPSDQGKVCFACCGERVRRVKREKDSMERKQKILAALATFARQRSGIEYGNYGDWQSFNAERRTITRDLAHVNRLLRAVKWRHSITADDILRATRAYSGRLQVTESPDGAVRVEYCTGQYFPTEYRKAVAAVLSSALWDWTRKHAMPSPIVRDGNKTYPHVNGSANEMSAGDWLRTHFRREFGPAIAQRYFS